MARGSTSSSSSMGNSNEGGAGDDQFECNICIDMAEEPVVTLCGHLFCWACLYRWLQRRGSRSESGCQEVECPVCKALVEEERLVPLYGRGNSCSRRRMGIPNRPRPPTTLTGQRQRQRQQSSSTSTGASSSRWRARRIEAAAAHHPRNPRHVSGSSRATPYRQQLPYNCLSSSSSGFPPPPPPPTTMTSSTILAGFGLRPAAIPMLTINAPPPPPMTTAFHPYPPPPPPPYHGFPMYYGFPYYWAGMPRH